MNKLFQKLLRLAERRTVVRAMGWPTCAVLVCTNCNKETGIPSYKYCPYCGFKFRKLRKD